MDNETIKRHVNILEEMTECIKTRLDCAVIDRVEDFYQKDCDLVIRRININRGTSNYQVAFSWSGLIEGHTGRMPVHMIVDIHNAICSNYLRSILDELAGQRSIEP